MRELYKIKSLESLEGEVWVPIPNYEGYYEISNLGRIKRLQRTIPCCYNSTKTVRNRILQQELTKRGYLRVSIFKEGVKEKRFVHSLVLKAFVQNPENKETTNHINGVKSDNRVENLEWATQSENCLHAYRTGLAKLQTGVKSHRYGKRGAQSALSKPVAKMTKDFVFIKKYESILLAAEDNNVFPGNISKVCYGKRNYCGNYTWKFI